MKTAVLAGVCAIAMACGCSAPHCDSGDNYCMDPGGNGADRCCPASHPYFCANKETCITQNSEAFFDGSCGKKIFCSSEY